MLVAFRAKPIVQSICGNCECWKEYFDFGHNGLCKISGGLYKYNHKCDVPEEK